MVPGVEARARTRACTGEGSVNLIPQRNRRWQAGDSVESVTPTPDPCTAPTAATASFCPHCYAPTVPVLPALPPCPCSTASHEPSARFHTRAVWSSEAVTTRMPCLSIASALILKELQ